MAVPADTPVTFPVAEPTVATDVLLLLQVPPLVTSDSGIEKPTQTTAGPVIAAGIGLTVTTVVVKHPEARV